MSSRSQVQMRTQRKPSFTNVPAGFLQRKKGLGCVKDESHRWRQPIQRKSADSAETSEMPPIVYEVLRSPGQPLDLATRTFMESRFGHDFSRVRVHTDAQAAKSTWAINAIAYTMGQDIVFQHGQYRPELTEGKELIAHELTHVLQQGSGSLMPYPSGVSVNLGIGQQGDAFEQEANCVSRKLSHVAEPRESPSGHVCDPLQVQRGIGLYLQRQQRRPTQPRRGQSTQTRPLVQINIDSEPAQLDESRSIDQITREFYHIPVCLLLDDFCLTYELNERDIQTRTRPFGLGTGSNLQTVECWTNHVRFDAQLRQTILLPNDLATHPCMQGQDPTESRRELLEHERLHEADNNRAAETTRTRLLTRLGFTLGIGPLMAMVRITDDQQGFVQECSRRIRGRLDQIRDEHDLIYHRLSTEYASILDPHDRELHSLKQRLLEEARARKSSQSLSGGP